MFVLETERLRLRNWREEDRNLFREINRDPKVMEYFPFRRSHEEADILFERVRTTIREDGIGFYAVALKDSDEAIGFCGLSNANLAPELPDGVIEIGWRLATRFWGHGYVTEAARALLSFGFDTCGFNEIVSFAVAENHRSTAVMQRIGLKRDASRDFDNPRVPDSHPHLKHHVLYAITAAEYRAKNH
ncbi:GNAT family N-acetyltransferase [Agrobacterium sp. ES01]|uniref:GNAT family N-acetyltransferase n=1 Tax=Agrobacterium sp. ES01 TaxID=3420714 RepID=UPI003D10CC46